jgi:4-amino-4-deoxy-L-arabinose transferase-like glycosyltransferase
VPFAGRDDAFYQAYPVQIPLIYTYIYLASGWVNEYLAKVIPTLFGLGCLPAAYVLGKVIYDERTGWLGALLLALTPTFARWASSGYVDLPMAFVYTLSAIFAWRLWQNNHWLDALLAGLMIGSAAWTKNAALLGIVFLAAWLGYGWLNRRISLKMALLTLAACGLVAAPWYIRNWLEARLLVPPTAWVEQAEPSLNNLLVFITLFDNFGVPGFVLFGGVLAAAWRVLQHRRQAEGDIFLLLWIIPFFFVWWLLVSYDPRFLLLFLPLVAVLGGKWLAYLWKLLPTVWQRRVLAPLIALMLVLTFYQAWISVEFKTELLHNPLMGDAEKHAVVLGDR